MIETIDTIKVFCDGGSRGNPGPAASGVVFTTDDNKIIATYSQYLGVATNNQAEYQAMILALQKLADFNFRHVDFYLDSELVVKQIKGEYRVKNSDLQPIYQQIKEALKSLTYTISHIRREYNQLADKAVNDCLDAKV